MISVNAASWDGKTGTTRFTFSDGSEGCQHYVKRGTQLVIGPLHSLTQEQHQAVVKFIDKANTGQGVL